MNKKQEIIKLLTHNNNGFSGLNIITEDDFLRIITLYEDLFEKEFLKSGDWHRNNPYYSTTANYLAMQKSIYEIIKNNNNYHDLLSILNDEYEKELNRKLRRTVYSYGEPTDESYQAPYSEMPEYSLVLADMCSRRMEEAQKQTINSEEGVIPESSLKTYETIKKDFISAGIEMPEKSEETAQSIQALITQKEAKEATVAENERQKKEIELMTLQQEINRIENEKLDLEKRIKTISSETLGSYFMHQIEERFPDEYNTYQQYQKQVQVQLKPTSQITDLKEKFGRISEELQFYRTILPTYERVYQRFSEIKAEKSSLGIEQMGLEEIYNLIYREENERLKKNQSLYTAWDLGNKKIPPKYQGLTYEQVASMINQEKAIGDSRKETVTTRDDLIIKAIRKDLGIPETYRLSDVQIKNLRKEFEGYSDEELQQLVSGVTAEEDQIKLA